MRPPRLLGVDRGRFRAGRRIKAELLTGIEGVSSRPVRRIVLISG